MWWTVPKSFNKISRKHPWQSFFIKFIGLQHANLVKKDSSNGYFGKCFRGAILQQILPEVYLEPRQISKMEICKKIATEPLKEMRNSYFCVTPQNHFSSNNSKNTVN